MRRTRDDLLRGIPGVGVVATLTMLAKCPELGMLNRRDIAAFEKYIQARHNTKFAFRYSHLLQYSDAHPATKRK